MSELLDAVRGFLESDVIPALEGRKQFHARVAANVLAIAERELLLESAHLEAEWRRLDGLFGEMPMPAEGAALRAALLARNEALSESIRRGEADAGERRRAVLDHVRQTVREKLAVANPKLLGPAPAGEET
jgi:hypothetical protein